MSAMIGASPWMKKATVLTYTRISDMQQSKDDRKKSAAKEKPALLQQYDYVKKGLESMGLPRPKKSDWYAEVRSGTDRERGQWKALQARAMELAHEGKRVFIAVQDPSRWSRNTRHSLSALDRLHDAGIPVLAIREGIQTGSAGDLHPTEELLFVQLQGGASFVSQEQKKKAIQAVDLAKETGRMSGKGQSLFPFAREDPLDAYYDQLPLLTVDRSEGGGVTAFRGTIEGMTAPDGISIAGVRRLEKAELERKAKLTEEEYRDWYDYRKKIRNKLIELEHDPFANNTKTGRINFPARALMAMTGRSLQEPWKYKQRTDEEIEDILTNFKDYLGTKDLKRYTAIVGKR